MDLKDVYDDFERESAEILLCFQAPVPNGTIYDGTCRLVHGYSIEICTIRLYCAWQNFCRQLVILSAYSSPLSPSGNVVPPVLPSEIDAINSVKNFSKMKTGKSYEPNWADANRCLQVAQHLNLRNFSSIAVAIGSTPSPVEVIKAIRDYFAHRNNDTLHKVIIMPVMSGHTISDLPRVIGQTVPSGVSLFEDWILTLRNMGLYAIQYP
jgi:hypothetical protein